MDISFVIPCYNSAGTIEGVVEEIHALMSTHPEQKYEIVLVSDGSPDEVYSVIAHMAQGDRRVTGVELAKNFGQHAALMAGYRCCSGSVIVSLDDDGQTPVDESFKLIDKLQQGSDVVYGSYPHIRQNPFRVLGSRINDLMMVVLIGKPRQIRTTSFFACRRFVITEMLRYHNSYPYLAGLVFRTTNRINTVEVNHRSRERGISNYSLHKLLALWLNGATAFSVKPLRVATVFGGLCALVGFVWTLFTIVHKILNPSVPAGYSSMMAVLLFTSGMIMILLGIIGEYVGRTYIIQNMSPQYVVRQTTGALDEKPDHGTEWTKNDCGCNSQ
ncbi:MAG: glycosyltransferase family 2 protein [Actinomycetes bacterium]|jgi:undecaprenyl-phosphate 4-deoxy-4-formamido-L-arabinose transferase|nr:glycosyltransferase family 2 protein [Actinomycetes bacterium]